MISITYISSSDSLVLMAEGHAGLAPHGKDIVCSAVSSLLFALAEYVDTNDRESVARVDEGEAHIQASTDMSQAFDLVYTGLCGIERSYPDNVSVKKLDSR
jgi:uncharacterized protein YsxB (DUF464 family)